MKKTLIIVTCLLCVGAAAAGNRLPAADEMDGKVDAFVQSELQRQHIPGAAVGVYRDGKLTRAQGYGLANVEWNAAVTPETIFQSGSVGKQFTATAVMMLVEEGKVGLDDPIKKYFPDAPETWNDIKVHNLLSHTSGLSEYETGARTKLGGRFICDWISRKTSCTRKSSRCRWISKRARTGVIGTRIMCCWEF